MNFPTQTLGPLPNPPLPFTNPQHLPIRIFLRTKRRKCVTIPHLQPNPSNPFFSSPSFNRYLEKRALILNIGMSRSESLSVDMSDGAKDVSECVCGSDVSEEISLEEQAVVWIITPALIFLIFIILIVIWMLICRRTRVIVKTIPFEDSEESIVYMEDMKEVVATPTDPVDMMRRLRHHSTTQLVYSPIQVNELHKKVKRLSLSLKSNFMY
ncbi:hypothetical protein JTE90_008397 [Oedothorax gibbosus]|uniref:Uncharacterized protein n=1 Tax=Oedothorax gibbosus TaxID=931172 RepID=A0AAV6V579_9ARAC|nr:hypothetical protein JTE90_008397 [Oedothorax gibbosus]